MNLKRRLLVVLLMLASTAFGQSYSLPGLHLIEPNPADGRPLLVYSGCVTPSMDGWEIPILVYADSNVEHYVDKTCLAVSAQFGFGRSGKYDVRVYTFYKAKDGFCNTYPILLSKPEFMRECRRVIYKTRRLNVDTRNKKMLVTEVLALDEDGRHLAFLPGEKAWHPIADLDSLPLAQPFRSAIDRITQLMAKEQERWDDWNDRISGGHGKPSEPPPPPATPADGVASGEGPRVGPGRGGGEAFKVGGGVSAPKAIYAPDPKYSEEAVKAKFQGTCVLWLVVGPDGLVRDIRVAKKLGMGLDEKAMEAVKTWKFKPAMQDGEPVAVQINVEVTFHDYEVSSGSGAASDDVVYENSKKHFPH
jgi:TonB family protein